LQENDKMLINLRLQKFLFTKGFEKRKINYWKNL